MRRVAIITVGLLMAAVAVSILIADEWISGVQAAPSRTITLFFSGWVQGNYGPCG